MSHDITQKEKKVQEGAYKVNRVIITHFDEILILKFRLA